MPHPVRVRPARRDSTLPHPTPEPLGAFGRALQDGPQGASDDTEADIIHQPA